MMQLGISASFRPEPPQVISHCDGQFLLVELEALDRVAAVAALRPLSDFVDPRELPDDFHGDDDEVDPLLEEWSDWFPIADGLAALDDLVHYLENDPSSHGLLAFPERTLFELRDLERCLEAADGHGTEFRLEIGPGGGPEVLRS